MFHCYSSGAHFVGTTRVYLVVNEHTTKCSCFYHICIFITRIVYSFKSIDETWWNNTVGPNWWSGHYVCNNLSLWLRHSDVIHWDKQNWDKQKITGWLQTPVSFCNLFVVFGLFWYPIMYLPYNHYNISALFWREIPKVIIRNVAWKCRRVR